MNDQPPKAAKSPDGVKVEYLTWEADERSPSAILLVPGLLNGAEFWAEDTKFIGQLRSTGRRVVAVSPRGRGGSECPVSGFGLDEHVSDIAAVLEAERIASVQIVGWSAGGVYALAYALREPTRVERVVVGDYLPFLPPLTPEWLEGARELAGEIGFAPELPDRLLAETQFEDLRGDLKESKLPILVVGGTQADAMMGDDKAVRVWDAVPSARVMTVESGHDVFALPEAQAACLEFLSCT